MRDPEVHQPIGSGDVQMWLEQAEQRDRIADGIEQQLMRGQFTDAIRDEAYERMLRYRQRAMSIRNNLKLAGARYL